MILRSHPGPLEISESSSGDQIESIRTVEGSYVHTKSKRSNPNTCGDDHIALQPDERRTSRNKLQLLYMKFPFSRLRSNFDKRREIFRRIYVWKASEASSISTAFRLSSSADSFHTHSHFLSISSKRSCSFSRGTSASPSTTSSKPGAISCVSLPTFLAS